MKTKELIAIELFKDDIIHGHLQAWEAPTADWDKASVNLKKAYYMLAETIFPLTTTDIRNIENPFEDAAYFDLKQYTAFELCRESIIKLWED